MVTGTAGSGQDGAMTGIEFLDDDGNVLDDPAPPPPTRRVGARDVVAAWTGGTRTARAAELGAPALWLAAAALAVVGCFRQVYSERIVSGVTYQQAMDGWGRFAHREDVSVADHGTRYGQLVCLAAGVLVVAAALVVLRRRAATPVAFGGAAALLGTVGAVWLTVRTDFEQIQAAFSRAGTLRPQVLQLQYGPFLWLGLAAVAAAGLGCVLAVIARGGIARGPAESPAAPVREPDQRPGPPADQRPDHRPGAPSAPRPGPPAEPAPMPLLAVVAAPDESHFTAFATDDGARDELLGTPNG
jgi:hypothetical protein